MILETFERWQLAQFPPLLGMFTTCTSTMLDSWEGNMDTCS